MYSMSQPYIFQFPSFYHSNNENTTKWMWMCVCVCVSNRYNNKEQLRKKYRDYSNEYF